MVCERKHFNLPRHIGNFRYPVDNFSSVTIPLLRRLFIVIFAKATGSSRRDFLMGRVLARVVRHAILINGHRRGGNTDLKSRYLINGMLQPIEQSDTPLEVLLEIRNDMARFKTLQSASLDILKERRCEGDGTGGDELTGTIALTSATDGIGASAKNRDTTDDIVLQWPSLRVRVKVTIEDQDSEGLVEAMLDGSDVDNPFVVLVVRSQVLE